MDLELNVIEEIVEVYVEDDEEINVFILDIVDEKWKGNYQGWFQ